MSCRTLVEGLEELLAALEARDVDKLGELSKALSTLAYDPTQLARARALHAQCEALSQSFYAELRQSVESTGRARRASHAYDNAGE